MSTIFEASEAKRAVFECSGRRFVEICYRERGVTGGWVTGCIPVDINPGQGTEV